MGILRRFLRRLTGGDELGGEHEPGTQDADDDGRPTDTRPVSEPTETGTQQSVDMMSVPALIEDLSTATGKRSSEVLMELVERADDDPREFKEHLDGLFNLLDDETTAGDASLVLLTLGAAESDLLTSHTERLVSALGDSSEDGTADLADTLLHLTGTASVPVGDLLDIVTDGPQSARSPAATVLGAVVTTDPAAIDIDRLLDMARDGDATSRGAALYLGTLLAGVEHDRSVPPELVAADRIELAGELRDGELDQWLQLWLSKSALKTIVDEVSPAAHCDQVDITRSSRGSHLMIAAARPGSVDRDAIQKATEQRLGMEFASITLVEPKEDRSASSGESNGDDELGDVRARDDQ